MAAEEPIRRVWSSNEFVCVTSGVLLKQLEGLKKEAIQKAAEKSNGEERQPPPWILCPLLKTIDRFAPLGLKASGLESSQGSHSRFR